MNIINTLSNYGYNRNEIRIIYNPSTKGPMQIFGKNFVLKNSEKCKIKVNDKPFKIVSTFEMKNTNEIKLYGINEITNMSEMFYSCS